MTNEGIYLPQSGLLEQSLSPERKQPRPAKSTLGFLG
jgi:hypothetical protein